MDVIVWLLLAILIVSSVAVIAVRARRREPGQRLVVFLSGLFLFMLGLWTVAQLFPLVPLLDRLDPVLSMLQQTVDPAGLLAGSTFIALVGLLVVRAIEHLSGARPQS